MSFANVAVMVGVHCFPCCLRFAKIWQRLRKGILMGLLLDTLSQWETLRLIGQLGCL